MSKLEFFRYLIGAICIIFSIVSKLNIGNIELSGSPNLAILGALFFYWPSLEKIINNFVDRGGNLKLLGMEAKIEGIKEKAEENKVEAEENYGIKIEELKTDIEELRKQLIDNKSINLSSSKQDVYSESKEEYFDNIVKEYRDLRLQYKEGTKVRQKRAEIDKKLIRGLGRLPIQKLEKRYEEQKNNKDKDQAISFKIAVAVSLGYHVPGEEESKVNDLLIKLLNDDQTSLIRFRAANSILRRGSRVDISEKEIKRLYDAIIERKENEKQKVTRNKCSEIEETLKSLMGGN